MHSIERKVESMANVYNIHYPTLQGIADLFRSGINDTFNNTTGTGTGSGNDAGLIMPNANPDLLNFMDSAIYETFSDLRNVGDPELILDNYILTGNDGKTPAQRLGLAHAPLDYEDIIYFS